MRELKYRQCPSCSVIVQAGHLIEITRGKGGWSSGQFRRDCPACGHRARTRDFPVTAGPATFLPPDPSVLRTGTLLSLALEATAAVPRFPRLVRLKRELPNLDDLGDELALLRAKIAARETLQEDAPTRV